MNKKQRHTPEKVKRYNKSFIEFMKPSEEIDAEVTKEISVSELTLHTEVKA